jgi:recombination protein RecA
MPRPSAAALAAARQAIRKSCPGVVVSFDDDPEPIKSIPSGIMLLDAAMGIGGFPIGRIIELYGPQSSGKSSVAMKTAAAVQASGMPVLYLDFEHAFDPSFALLFGVNLDEDMFVLAQPDNLEQGMEIAERYIEGSLVGIVIVDSLAAMVPKKELEGDIGDSHVALQARAMSQVLRRFTPIVAKTETIVLFINHIRDMIGGGGPARVGVVRRTTPGGVALKFYASVRIELQPMQSIKGKIVDPISGQPVDGTIALKVKATITKNKVGPPFRIATFYNRAGAGIYEPYTVVEIAEARGLIRKNGSRYILPFPKEAGSQEKVNLGGLEAVLRYLEENPGRYAKLRDKVQGFIDSTLVTAHAPTRVEIISVNDAPTPVEKPLDTTPHEIDDESAEPAGEEVVVNLTEPDKESENGVALAPENEPALTAV